MVIVGLTGGIATGKSLVSGYLKELGAYIIDWDVIAREIEEPRLPAWQNIVNYFGEEILQNDSKIDRLKLGQIVFNDVVKRLKLNSFTHPRIIEEAKKRERAIVESNPNAVVVHDVPLLFEVGIDKMVDKTVTVYATEEKQIERLRTRDGISIEDALSRIRSQMSLADKAKRADYVIDDSGSTEETKRQVQELYWKLVALASNECHPWQATST